MTDKGSIMAAEDGENDLVLVPIRVPDAQKLYQSLEGVAEAPCEVCGPALD